MTNPTHVRGTIKPLVWVRGSAHSRIGRYTVISEENDDEPFWFVMIDGKTAVRLGEHGSEEAAKSAAQADYEARILAQIDPDPEAHPVAWRRKHPQNGWIDCRHEDVDHYRTSGQEVMPLYAHPIASSEAPSVIASRTFAVQHNPNCPSPWLVRLPGGSGVIDLKPYLSLDESALTKDALGFGKTFEEAAQDAVVSAQKLSWLVAHKAPIHAQQPALSDTDAPQAAPSSEAGELLPCPFCNEELERDRDDFEHPDSEICPLDRLWVPARLVEAWNRRALTEAGQ